MRKRVLRTLQLSLLVLIAGLSLGAVSAQAALPVNYSFPAAQLDMLVNGATAPPGANDPNCQPSAAHPQPVVLVHGTFSNQRGSFDAISPLLKNNGYCVFTFNYGETSLTNGRFYALGPVAASAAQLSTFVDSVLSSTGATKVDIVGYSQGGMMPRYYIKNLGGAAKVDTLIGLAPSNHGTSLNGLSALATNIGFVGSLVNSACPACTDQIAGSPFLTALNAGGDTVPGVNYTVIESRYDEVVTPYTNAFLAAGPNVRNITLQNGCWFDGADHLAIAYDRRAATYVLNALDPAHPRSVPCDLVLPLVGG